MSEKHANVIEALVAVAADIDKIEKQGGGATRGRRAEDIYNAIHGPLCRHGVFIAPHRVVSERVEAPDAKPGWYDERGTVTFRAYGPGGRDDFIEFEASAIGRDNSDKATGKLLTYAWKSAVGVLLSIPTDATIDNEGQAMAEDVIDHSPRQRQAPQDDPEVFDATYKDVIDRASALHPTQKAGLKEWVKENKLSYKKLADLLRIKEDLPEWEAESNAFKAEEAKALAGADPIRQFLAPPTEADDRSIDLVPTEHPQIPEGDGAEVGTTEGPATKAREKIKSSVELEEIKAVYAYLTNGGTQADADKDQAKLAITIVRRIGQDELAITAGGQVVYADSGELFPKEGEHAEAA